MNGRGHGSLGGSAEAMRIRLLGGFRVSVADNTVGENAWRLRKAASLVKLLVLAPGHRLHREQAMSLLWPDLGKKAASNNLRQTLHAARKAFDSAATASAVYLSSRDEQIELCSGGELWVDVEAFEAAAAAARRSSDLAAYRAALNLYAGDLLPEDRYEEWAEGRREELRQTFLSLLVELSELYEKHGEFGPAVEALQRVAKEDPTSERAQAGLMRLYALSDRQGEALVRYERLREALSERLGAEPGATTRRLREDIATGRLPSDRSLVGSLPEEQPDAGKHNLPAPRTRFVGREREMIEVKRELAMTRLLTLTGTGGSGKTRLALEVGRDLIGVYPDGVWLVELAPLSEPQLVAQEVASALKVQERRGQPIADTLLGALGDREMLLVVDNCEHLVDAAARLADALLDSCPHLRVLATSREPLGISGEVNRTVPPLSLPAKADGGPDEGSDRRSDGRFAVDSLMHYEALRLFVDRARLRLPDFRLTQENAGAVTRVCRKLDGIPLAIELATARMGALAVEQVGQRLEVSLDVLKATSRTAAPRQQTLRATIDWSHDLLSGAERALFRRLSVFAGGWTLEAAEAVGSGEGVEQEDVLDLLSGLTDKSLVTADTAGELAPRYGMLEPIRQYALEKLEDSGEAERVRRVHAAFFRTLAEEAEPKYRGAEEAEWLGRLEAEHDNVRAALSWALGGGDTKLGLGLAGAMGWFWRGRWHLGEGRRWLEEALTRTEDTAEPAARAAALSVLGNFCSHQEDVAQAEIYLSEAIAVSRDLGDPLRLSEALGTLAWLATKRGDHTRARTLYEESVEIARESGDVWAVAGSLVGLGWIAANEGDFERARRLWEEGRTIDREMGTALGVAMTSHNIGFLEVALGNFARASVVLEEGLALGRKLGNRGVIGGCFSIMGLAEALGGDPKRGYGLLMEALAITAELEIDLQTVQSLESIAIAAGVLGKHARAARLWGAGAVFRDINDQPWFPLERMVCEPQLNAARSQTDEALWEAEFAEGRTMSLEEAVDYALSEEDLWQAATTALGERSTGSQPPSLTRREKEITTLLAQGLANRQIAEELFVSERTVENHVSNILKKLNLSSREQVAARITDR